MNKFKIYETELSIPVANGSCLKCCYISYYEMEELKGGYHTN